MLQRDFKVGWEDGTLMPPLALRMFFFLLGSASAGCLPLLELSGALRARAEMNEEDTAWVTYGIILQN